MASEVSGYLNSEVFSLHSLAMDTVYFRLLWVKFGCPIEGRFVQQPMHNMRRVKPFFLIPIKNSGSNFSPIGRYDKFTNP